MNDNDKKSIAEGRATWLALFPQVPEHIQVHYVDHYKAYGIDDFIPVHNGTYTRVDTRYSYTPSAVAGELLAHMYFDKLEEVKWCEHNVAPEAQKSGIDLTIRSEQEGPIEASVKLGTIEQIAEDVMRVYISKTALQSIINDDYPQVLVIASPRDNKVVSISMTPLRIYVRNTTVPGSPDQLEVDEKGRVIFDVNVADPIFGQFSVPVL